jgi:hypothetical protein
MDRTQRLLSPKYRWFAIAILAVCFTDANAAASNDPLTGLPVYPGVTDASPLPEGDFCGKQMTKDFYMVMGNKIYAITKWYAGRLAGYHRYHAMINGRSLDIFFSPDGKTEVTVTGTKIGSAVYSISYGRFQPGLTAGEMISFSQSKKACE